MIYQTLRKRLEEISRSLTEVESFPEQKFVYNDDPIHFQCICVFFVEFDIKEIPAESEDEKATYEFYMNGEKIEDEDKFKELYQYFISAYGEDIYTDEAKGEFICSLT